MMLLPVDLTSRRAIVAGTPHLTALAEGLSRELEPLRCAPMLPIPETKARMTRRGGRCPHDGTLLAFDPWSPRTHRCTRCEVSWTDPEHHEWWAMNAQLYVAERAVHAAALAQLRQDERDRQLARRILAELAARYRTWPNRDNVLGPTRPFFSTYLESIWLLNLCHAVALLEAVAPFEESDAVRAQVLEPSSALIASYHEGRSNRQVWNEVAILSAWTLLGRHAHGERRLDGGGSLPSLLSQGLLDDGTWYEGENYHLFAHRGLWYGVQWLRTAGRPLDAELDARFHEGFIVPFTGVLPDETLPARRDSQYRTSIRQWRTAEHLELGFAHRADSRIAGLLHRMYDGQETRSSDARSRSTADAEQNEPAMALSRASGSWRALLMASADPLPDTAWHPTSVVQPRQGVAIVRREQGQVYVALEGGETGGGHGHPDRLALTLQIGRDRWLDDPGTGSYVESVLHWYRSTLAHHAPLVDGASQHMVPAQLMAFEDRDGAGWVRKRAEGIAPGVTAVRTVVVCDGYLVDQLEWAADREVRITLPIAADLMLDPSRDGEWMAGAIELASGLEDGAAFVRDVDQWVPRHAATSWSATMPPIGAPDAPHRAMRWWGHVHGADASTVRLLRASVPGPPGFPRTSRHIVEARGRAGAIRSVWSWSPTAEADPSVREVTWPTAQGVVAAVTTIDGTTATHQSAPHGWHIALTARHARSSIDLQGQRPCTEGEPAGPVAEKPVDLVALDRGDVATWTLGAAQYVPTEEPWGGDNTPRVHVSCATASGRFRIDLDVMTGHPIVGPGGTADQMPENPLDNERADINADGVQIYFGRANGTWRSSWLCVPLPDGSARITALHASMDSMPRPMVSTQPRPSGDGWTMSLAWTRADIGALADRHGQHVLLPFDLVVNERPPERERRRGQLILSGGGGFGYLRGDRHEPARLIMLRLPDDQTPDAQDALSSRDG